MATSSSSSSSSSTPSSSSSSSRSKHALVLPNSTTASRGWTTILMFTTIMIHVGLLSMRYISTVSTQLRTSAFTSTTNWSKSSSSSSENLMRSNEAMTSTSTSYSNQNVQHVTSTLSGPVVINDDQFYDNSEDKAAEEDDRFFVERKHRDHDDHEINHDGRGEDDEGGSTFSSTSSTTLSSMTDRGPKYSQKQKQMNKNTHVNGLRPHWMVITECSIYNLDCMTRATSTNQYRPYPLGSNRLRDMYSHGEWPNMTVLREEDGSTIQISTPGTNVTSHTTVLPTHWWTERLAKPPTSYHPGAAAAAATTAATTTASDEGDTTTPLTLDELNYLYPPRVSDEEYNNCIDRTRTKSTIEQLDDLLSSGSIQVEPTTNMLAWTISDWNYVYDMIHDVVQMMDKVVKIGGKHFLVVAIDDKTTRVACRHGYPVISWKPPAPPSPPAERTTNNDTESENKQVNDQGEDETALRDAVANTKVVLSYELVKRGIDFFFTEMDVWWIASPIPSLLKLQSNTEDDRYQMYFSAHQNNPWAPNIGIYAAKANKRTQSYFELCIKLLTEKPDTHDQFVMTEVRNLYVHVYDGRPYNFLGGGQRWKPDGPPTSPNSTDIDRSLAFDAYMWTPHEIVGDERPVPTHTTLAIHTLNGRPLQLPHGKKMVAREIGAYYGFVTSPNVDDESNSGTSPLAGYYQRRGAPYRRYLLLDSHIRTSLYSMVLPHQYHGQNNLQVVMAILMTLAIRTNRILVMPQIVNADMDAGLYMLWNIMDYSGLEFIHEGEYEGRRIDIRETNFMSNPKSWRIPQEDGEDGDDDYWPFESVAMTTVEHGIEGMPEWTIWAQMTNKDEVTSRQSWGVHFGGIGSSNTDGLLDVLFGALTATPDVDDSELLLVNLDAVMHTRYDRSLENHLRTSDLSPIEYEVQDVYRRLTWCWDRGLQKTAGKSSASDSCYGNGINPFKTNADQGQRRVR